MNRFKPTLSLVSLICAVLLLIGAAGISFVALFGGLQVRAASPGLTVEIQKVTDNAGGGGYLFDGHTYALELKVTDTNLVVGNYNKAGAELSFADDTIFALAKKEDVTFSDSAAGSGTGCTYTVSIKNLKYHETGADTVDIALDMTPNDNTPYNKTAALSFDERKPNNSSADFGIVSYQFYDRDGDELAKLKKGTNIEELKIVVRDKQFTAQQFNSASKSEFSAAINYTTFKPRDSNRPYSFSTATTASDGAAVYTITFEDLQYTGKTDTLELRIGYPSAWGLPRRSFNETLPEGEIYVEPPKEDNSSSSSSSEVEIPPPTPNLIVDSYSYGGGSVAAASNAALTLTFTNTSKRVSIDNVVMKITMPEALTLTNSSNTFYIERMRAGASETQTINFSVKPNAEPISHSIKVSFTFEAVIKEERKSLTSEQEIAIPVTQPNRMVLQEVEVPEQVMIGDGSGSFEANFVNKGKSTVYNVTASIEGENLAQTGQLQFMGNLESGKTGTADFVVDGLQPGPITGEVVLSFEDANMRVTELRTPFTSVAIEMPQPQMPPMMGEDPLEGADDLPTSGPMAWIKAVPIWSLMVGGLVIVLLIAFGIKLARQIREKKLEAEDEDF